jgi:hypothetical protein
VSRMRTLVAVWRAMFAVGWRLAVYKFELSMSAITFLFECLSRQLEGRDRSLAVSRTHVFDLSYMLYEVLDSLAQSNQAAICDWA